MKVQNEDPKYLKHLGIALKEARNKLGVTQKQVAKAIDIGRLPYHSMEAGKQRLNYHQMIRLVTFYRKQGLENDYNYFFETNFVKKN